MRRSRVLSLAAAGASSLLLVSTAGAQAPGPFYCATRDFAKRVAYVSPIFNAQAADIQKVNAEWHAMMTAKYGITALPYQSCNGPYPSVASADTTRRAFLEFMHTRMNQPVTELNWTYAGAPAITVAEHAPSAATSTASAGGTSTGSAAAPAAPAVATAADSADALAEMSVSKGYCEQNYRGLFDCDCFARAVLRHRLEHPGEWETLKMGERRRPPVHDLAIGIQYKLDCSDCLDDARLSAWARNRTRGEFEQMVMTKMLTQAQVDRYAECVATAFPKRYREMPYLDKYQQALNDARASCGNPQSS
ncbi:MAG TPA: hypothetical protein VFK13_08455 [Gemmatimonadaceae bacterium]|nr:hypothetical protein [Gemmatimonadaceae bacterium]